MLLLNVKISIKKCLWSFQKYITYTLSVIESALERDPIDFRDQYLLGGDPCVAGQRLPQVPDVRIDWEGEAYPDLARRLVQVHYGDYHRAHLK